MTKDTKATMSATIALIATLAAASSHAAEVLSGNLQEGVSPDAAYSVIARSIRADGLDASSTEGGQLIVGRLGGVPGNRPVRAMISWDLTELRQALTRGDYTIDSVALTLTYDAVGLNTVNTTAEVYATDAITAAKVWATYSPAGGLIGTQLSTFAYNTTVSSGTTTAASTAAFISELDAQIQGGGPLEIMLRRAAFENNTGDVLARYAGANDPTSADRPKLTVAYTIPNAITNGFFQAGGGSLTGWTNTTSATTVAGIAPMSTTAARLGFGTSGDLRQAVAASSGFSVDFYVQSAGTNEDRSLNLLLGTTAGDTGVNLRLAGGTNTPGGGLTLQARDGGTSSWVDLSTADFFAANGVYRIRIEGIGFGTAGAMYDVYWSDINGFDLVNSALALTTFQTAAVVTGGAFDEVIFRRDSTSYNSFVIDDVLVSIPVPAALPAGLGLLGLIAMRRPIRRASRLEETM